MTGEFHPTKTIRLGSTEVEVDEPLATVVAKLNSLGIDTLACCQNYADYLRSVAEMDHAWDSKREYGYIEFPNLETTLRFINLMKEKIPPIEQVYFRITFSGSPDAWEVRYLVERTAFWVLFPEYDIATIEAALA